jgi:uncharacterized protein YndB with AHSA1/START domain
METQEKTVVNIGTTVNAPIKKIWEIWSKPEHITRWATPTPDWHTPRAENDLRTGGSFVSRMEAKDGSMGFDFGGVYDVVTPHEYIEYTMGDGRKVKTVFTQQEDGVRIDQSFDAEAENPVEMQRMGWQAILDSFKNYTESN